MVMPDENRVTDGSAEADLEPKAWLDMSRGPAPDFVRIASPGRVLVPSGIPSTEPAGGLAEEADRYVNEAMGGEAPVAKPAAEQDAESYIEEAMEAATPGPERPHLNPGVIGGSGTAQRFGMSVLAVAAAGGWEAVSAARELQRSEALAACTGGVRRPAVDWPEGDYLNACTGCGVLFAGGREAWFCKGCHDEGVRRREAMPPEERAAVDAARVIEMEAFMDRYAAQPAWLPAHERLRLAALSPDEARAEAERLRPEHVMVLSAAHHANLPVWDAADPYGCRHAGSHGKPHAGARARKKRRKEIAKASRRRNRRK